MKELPALPKKWAVAHIGPYLHYIAARALFQQERLACLLTDLSAAKGLPKFLSRLCCPATPRFMRRLAGRYPVGIPSGLIRHCPWIAVGLLWDVFRNGDRGGYEIFLRSNQRFGRVIAGKQWADAKGVYALSSQAKEIFMEADQRGIKKALDVRIVPTRSEAQLLELEYDAYPDFEDRPLLNSSFHESCDRDEEELKLADKILCPSTFVRDCIHSLGVPSERCAVVNYAYDNPRVKSGPRVVHRPLRVLTVGSVGLRKGVPYLLGAANATKKLAQFRMVGPVHVKQHALQKLRGCVDVVGAVPRAEIGAHYEWADVFLLPSICEGSATVTYEALSWGLPVICTPNAGSVVREQVDGFIVPIRDSPAIVRSLELLARSPSLHRSMSGQALSRSETFSLDNYAKRLTAVLDSI